MSNGSRLPASKSAKLGVPGLVASMLAGLLLASPGAAEPGRGNQPLTIHEAQQRISLLNHQAEIASEQLNAARVRLAAARERLATLQADLQYQRARVSALRADVVSSALADYQNAAGLSTTTSFLVADDPEDFLQSLATKTIAEQQQSGLLSQLSQQQRQLGIQKQQAQRELAAVADNKSALAAHNVQLRRKTEQAEAVLHELRAKQRQRLARIQARQAAFAEAQASRSAQRVNTGGTSASGQGVGAQTGAVSAASGSSRASVAVSYALAQVGDPYVYGAAGPDAFDCSGLTMAAWAAAGVSIPHASSLQPGAGTPVSVSALLPGDLVFYYSPISHVGMYIGNGQVVHAPHTGAYVEVVPLTSMPVSMAVRIG